LERFHLTNAISYADGVFDTFRDIDLTLTHLGCHLVVFSVDDAMVGARIAEAFRQRGSRWQAYQERLQEKVGDLGVHYADMQRKFLDGAEWTNMNHLVIDTTDKDWRRCADEIMEFWRI
jgi:hypothetical protein